MMWSFFMYRNGLNLEEIMKPDKAYRLFLQGKLYPEIKVRHETADGKCRTDERLKDRTKFFKLNTKNDE